MGHILWDLSAHLVSVLQDDGDAAAADASMLIREDPERELCLISFKLKGVYYIFIS